MGRLEVLGEMAREGCASQKRVKDSLGKHEQGEGDRPHDLTPEQCVRHRHPPDQMATNRPRRRQHDRKLNQHGCEATYFGKARQKQRPHRAEGKAERKDQREIRDARPQRPHRLVPARGHLVVGAEEFAGMGDDLAIGGVVHRLHAFDQALHCMIVHFNMFHQFGLGTCRADDQDM